MSDRSKDEIIQRSKEIAQLKMRQHYREQEELKEAARILSSDGNRKQRRAFASRNRVKP